MSVCEALTERNFMMMMMTMMTMMMMMTAMMMVMIMMMIMVMMSLMMNDHDHVYLTTPCVRIFKDSKTNTAN